MKYIQLTQNKQAVIDDEDYEALSQYKWYYKQGYAVRNSHYLPGKKRYTVRMHRQVADTPRWLETDHINGDKLDNRRCNLRVCTKSQNMRNRKKQLSSSNYKGVYWNKQNNRWQAQIQVDKKQIYLGHYLIEQEAAQAYTAAAKKYFGEFARV